MTAWIIANCDNVLLQLAKENFITVHDKRYYTVTTSILIKQFTTAVL